MSNNEKRSLPSLPSSKLFWSGVGLLVGISALAIAYQLKDAFENLSSDNHQQRTKG